MFQGTVFLLIGACDRIEESGKRIIRNCYAIQKNFAKSWISDELTLLVEYMKALAPKISACGLIDVNRKLYLSFFSVTITYIIVILQFRRG